MINEQRKHSEPNAAEGRPRVLVVGDGTAGLLAARALVDVGIDVSLTKSDSFPASLYGGAPGMDLQKCVSSLSSVLQRVERLEWNEGVQVLRHGNGFVVTSGQEPSKYFGCIVLAPGLPLKPVPGELPEGVELLGPGIVESQPQSVGFLLDYAVPSDPSEGMTAVAQALANRAAGGESAVFMRHVPVRHLFGESLYESAKSAGVRFFRFGDRRPRVENLPHSTGSPFVIVVDDIIEGGDPISVPCDKVVAAVRPDATSLPSWAVDAIGEDTDRAGFLLSSSVHCHPATSFKGGIFAVGAATGTFDLLDVAAQAATVAAEARAWMMKDADAGDGGKISIADECCRCLTCFRICPHNAFSYEGQAARSGLHASAAACQECGVCVSECPRQALDVIAFPEATVSAFLAEVERTAESGPLVVYGCRRSAARAVSQTQLPQSVLFCSVPCAGSVSESLLLTTATAGAAGVLVVGCHHGNCASRDGTDWAEARVKNATAAVSVPLRYATAAANEEARLARVISEFYDSIKDSKA